MQQEPAGIFVLAFSSDGRTLISGTRLGSVQIRSLEDPGETAAWLIPANRGKVQHLATSPGRGFLLGFNELHRAYLWDLGRRSCRRLAGEWSSGTFISDDLLVLADRPGAQRSGGLVRIDRRSMVADGDFYARSAGKFTIPLDIRFDSVTLSPDGSRIAASAGPSQIPLVCIWETASGKLTHWISAEALDHPAISLSFSERCHGARDRGRFNAGRSLEPWPADGIARRSGRDHSGREIPRYHVRPDAPGSRRQLVSGHSDGRLLLWTWEEGQSRLTAPGQILAERFFNGAVHAVTFTADGRYVAAAGDGTLIWLAQMEPRVTQIRDLGTPPHHFEQINALTIWTDWSAPGMLVLSEILAPGLPPISPPACNPLLVSGSDDTTIRFWDIENHSLLGTFCVHSRRPRRTSRSGRKQPANWTGCITLRTDISTHWSRGASWCDSVRETT